MNSLESMHTVRKRVHIAREDCSTVRKRSPNVRKHFCTAFEASTSLPEIFPPASGRTTHEFLLTFWKFHEVILTSLSKHSTADHNIHQPSGTLIKRRGHPTAFLSNRQSPAESSQQPSSALNSRQQRALGSRPENSPAEQKRRD